MELQYHPSSGRRAVTVVSLGPRGERVVLAFAALAAFLGLSLLWTGPRVLRQKAREAARPALERELEASRAARHRVRAEGDRLAARVADWDDRLAKAAFLYDVSPSEWPRALDPSRLGNADDATLADRLAAQLQALERARAILGAREAADPDLPERTPSVAPIAGGAYEAASLFGPRVSPWTGQSEFFCGLDLAAEEGAPVRAPAAGRVVFVGRARRDRSPRLWQFGTLVIVRHGPRLATVYGHLGRADVRRDALVRRGDRLGAVGRSGWAVSPRLHYELWRLEGGALRPTDPLFAILDPRRDARHRTLRLMLATSAPGPAEELPGLR